MEPPTDSGTVVFAHLDDAARSAQVGLQLWRSPPGRDIALLGLEEPAPAQAWPLSLGSSSGVRGHQVKSFGFPINAPGSGHYGYGVAGDQILGDGDAPLLQLTDCTEVTEGFRGGPVLDEHTGLVVGMVSSLSTPDPHDRGRAPAYVTPTQTLHEVRPELTISQICPYRGLESFTTAHAGWFHGRDRAVEAVLASVRRDHRLRALLGPSGRGKSSLIHASVMPALVRGEIPGRDRWGWLSIRLGADPFVHLEQAGPAGAVDGLASPTACPPRPTKPGTPDRVPAPHWAVVAGQRCATDSPQAWSCHRPALKPHALLERFTLGLGPASGALGRANFLTGTPNRSLVKAANKGRFDSHMLDTHVLDTHVLDTAVGTGQSLTARRATICAHA